MNDLSQTARRLLARLKPFRVSLGAATVVMLLDTGVSLLAPRVAGQVVDQAILHSSANNLAWIALALLGVFFIRGVLRFVEHLLVQRTGSFLLRNLRQELFAKLLQLGPDFYDSQRLGEISSRLSADLVRLQVTLTTKVPEGVQAVVTFIGTLIVLLLIQTTLTGFALAVVPPLVLIAMWLGSKLEKLAKAVQDAQADGTATADETLAGLMTVQSFAQEPTMAARYLQKLDRIVSLQMKSAKLVGLFLGAMSFVGFGSFALVLWYGGVLIQQRELSPGDLTSFLLYLFAIASSVATLGGLYGNLRELSGVSARMFEILDRPIQFSGGTAKPALTTGHIEFRNVTFQYLPDRPALGGVSFKVLPGQTIAFVGPSGAGKSTLFSLLLGHYTPTSGAILVDGHDVATLDKSNLRNYMAQVPQEIFLFHGTCAENIGFGRPSASQSEIEEAAKHAGADDFIRALPKGYDELVGERGTRLSVGQKQRIAIARAFLRQPRFLLLDEATSSLDADSEALIQKALLSLMQKRTTLVIAHRLATAKRADCIFVMNQGHIVAQGKHQELLQNEPIYKRYWQLQSLEPVENID